VCDLGVAIRNGLGGGDNGSGRKNLPFGRRPERRSARLVPSRIPSKGAIVVIYGEPETLRFLAAVQRLKREKHRKERLTRLAKQRVRAALRKMREC
jgi:hypothetical protein